MAAESANTIPRLAMIRTTITTGLAVTSVTSDWLELTTPATPPVTARPASIHMNTFCRKVLSSIPTGSAGTAAYSIARIYLPGARTAFLAPLVIAIVSIWLTNVAVLLGAAVACEWRKG